MSPKEIGKIGKVLKFSTFSLFGYAELKGSLEDLNSKTSIKYKGQRTT